MTNRTRSGRWTIYPFRIEPSWIMPILSVYSFALMTLVTLKSASEYSLMKRWTVIAICLVGVEILNQFTYRQALTDFRTAARNKCIGFWCLFTASIVGYSIIVGKFQSQGWSFPSYDRFILYIFLSWFLPGYSVSPKWRFLLLHGEFQKWKSVQK